MGVHLIVDVVIRDGANPLAVLVLGPGCLHGLPGSLVGLAGEGVGYGVDRRTIAWLFDIVSSLFRSQSGYEK